MGPSYAKEILNIGITFTQDLEIFKIKININLRYINESGKLNIQHYLSTLYITLCHSEGLIQA